METNIKIYTCANNTCITGDVPIIRSVISIGHYRPLFLLSVSVLSERCNWYCNKCTNNVISCDYNIINCFHDTHKYRENTNFWKNQKSEGGYNIGLVSVIGTYLK